MTIINTRLGIGLCLCALALAVVPAQAQQSAGTSAATVTASALPLAVQTSPMAAVKADGAIAAADAEPAEQQRRRPPASPPDEGQNSGPMSVTPVRNMFVVQPTVRFGRVNHQDATIVGGNMGVIIDDHFFIGAGAQWLANHRPGYSMTYVGVVAGWRVTGGGPVEISVSSLVGGGRTENGYTGYYGPHVSVNPYFYYRDDVFVAEPQVDIMLKLGRRAWISAGASYRVVGGVFGSDLSGITGVVAVTFGSR